MLKDFTPFKGSHGHPPDVYECRATRCKSRAHVPIEPRTVSQTRAVPGSFLCFNTQQTATRYGKQIAANG